MKRTLFIALTMGTALAATPALAQIDPIVQGLRFCKDELGAVLSMHGMKADDLMEVTQMKVGKHQPSVVTIAKPKSCASGELRVTMWYTCTLQSINTVGDCKVRGVSSSPF